MTYISENNKEIHVQKESDGTYTSFLEGNGKWGWGEAETEEDAIAGLAILYPKDFNGIYRSTSKN